MSQPINFTQLSAPFALDDLEFRAGTTNNDKTKALALAYITSRAVMNRLDEVVGPANWRDEYRPGPDGGVVCGLSLRIEGEWVIKWDGAENTNFEAIKGGLSDAFKRAAVKWGIGRYLYNTPDFWVNCHVRGKTVVLDQAEARAKFSQVTSSNATPSAVIPQGTPPVAPQPPQPRNGNGQHPNDNGSNETSPKNGHRQRTGDPMTAYWTAIRERGLDRQQGQKLLAAVDGDPVKALAAMDRALARLN